VRHNPLATLTSRHPIGRAISGALLSDPQGRGTLLLVRHGQQDVPADGRLPVGWDPPLTELGRRQAEALAGHLESEDVAAVYASNLRRARETAAPVAARHGVPVVVRDGLHEVEMLDALNRADEMEREQLDAAAERFMLTRRWGAFGLGEGSLEFRERVHAAVEEILAAHPGGTVVVVCHGGVIAAYLAEVLGVEADMWFRPAHASVHRVWYLDDRRVINRLNEFDHFVGTELLTT
jgi:broad specificity phosphatase PhoE